MEVALFWPSILFVILFLLVLVIVLNEMVLVLEDTLCECVLSYASTPTETIKRNNRRCFGDGALG